MKKPPFLFSTLMVIIVSACLPLPARERRGAMVLVTMTDGSRIEGELLAIKTDALLVYDLDARQGKSLNLHQVTLVTVIKKAKFLQGLVVGAGIGIGILSSTGGEWPYHGDARMGNILVVPAACLFGGLLGAVAGNDRKFALAYRSVPFFQEKLAQLSRYAREWDERLPPRKVRRRFRLLWSPVIAMTSGKIGPAETSGLFRLVDAGQLNDGQVHVFQPFAHDASLNEDKNLRLRLEFEWLPRLSIGLEYLSEAKLTDGILYVLSFVSPGRIDHQKRYHSEYSGHNYLYSCDSLLLGLSWRPLRTSSAGNHSIDLGIAAGPTRVFEKVNNFRSNESTWMAKAHAAYDYFYTHHFSLGGFIEFQHLNALFPNVTFISTERFSPEGSNGYYDGVSLRTEFMIPGREVRLGGWGYGLRIGLSF